MWGIISSFDFKICIFLRHNIIPPHRSYGFRAANWLQLQRLICKSYTVACLPPERKYLPITYLTFAYFPVSAEWYCVGITVHFAYVSCSYINCSQYQLQKDHCYDNFIIYKREIPQKLLKYTIYFLQKRFQNFKYNQPNVFLACAKVRDRFWNIQP